MEAYSIADLKPTGAFEYRTVGTGIFSHLAVIAAVMKKEGVTPEKAVQIFRDIQAVCQKVVDGIQEGVVKAISSTQPELIEKTAYIRGFEQGRTQGIIDSQGGKK